MSKLNGFINRNRFNCGLMVSRMELVVIPREQLEENIKTDLSYSLAHSVNHTGKLSINKTALENGEMRCEAELFIFTENEMKELLEIARREWGIPWVNQP